MENIISKRKTKPPFDAMLKYGRNIGFQSKSKKDAKQLLSKLKRAANKK